jgi:class 3 adenylate cyclase
MQQLNSSNRISTLNACLLKAKETQSKLDIRSFQLKTLNDLSKELFGSVDIDTIIRNFLYNTMGNFGVIQGLVFLKALDTAFEDHFVAAGFDDTETEALQKNSQTCLFKVKPQQNAGKETTAVCEHDLAPDIELIFPFAEEQAFQGILGLGPKLMGSSFADHEKELLETLANNFIMALKNAHSFQEVLGLNQRLHEQNDQLEATLQELKASLKKVELLTNIKDNLSKFVPLTVSNMIAASPEGSLPDSKEQDLSVLFLDIGGYTKLCEEFDSTKVNEIVEKHFSVFMDAIHNHNGDVNETAGDGLMVLFLNEDQQKNALDAAQTALTIQKETRRIGRETYSMYRPLEIHMGIHSGRALVGATKFSSLTGSRWTYTARGSIVNVASRISSLARGSNILISKETAERVRPYSSVKPIGKYKLKNVSDEVEVYKLLPRFRNRTKH